jgi:hypothetical protein
MHLRQFPHEYQMDAKDCGLVCDGATACDDG